MAEQSDNQLVAQFEAVEDGAGLAQGVHCLRGGEAVGAAGLGEDVAPVDVVACGAQGVG